MTYKCLRILSGALFVLGLLMAAPHAAMADLTVYTDADDFAADLAGLGLKVEVLDFESAVSGTTYSDPSTIDGITFESFPGELIVTDLFAATSGVNYLGVDAPGFANQFIGGFEFDMQFKASHAIGFFIVTGETPNFSIFDGDVRLEVAGVGSVSIDVDDLQGIIGGSDNVFFVGLIEDMTPFSAAQVRYESAAVNSMSFNIDDISTARDAILLGDVNLDGNVNLLDVAPFIELLANTQFQAEADINMDGVVNLLDVDPFVQLLSGGG